MYAFSAAHRTLPLPSYARVTNLDNGRSVVVRVNDRGPFHDGRLIDLSYAAAVKLGIHRRGTGRVEVRALRPGDAGGTQLASSAPAPAAPATPSVMDALVGELATREAPAPTAVATGAVASAAPAGRAAGLADHPDYGREEDRFRLVDDNGRVRSADEFDAWMRARQARLAEADRAVAGGAGSAVATPSPPTQPAAVAAGPSGDAARGAPPAATGGDAVTLQVGVFSVRDNAERVLATLRGAGIAQAWIQDVASAGRTLWRVRVGPVAQVALGDLTARVSGLGLGMPQVVRD